MGELLRKKANAKIRNAQGRSVGRELTETMDALAGGTWVGGEIMLTDDELVFGANRVNRALQQGDLDARFPLTDIQNAEISGGFGTKVIRVDLADGSEFLFRCTGAKAVLDTLRSRLG